MPRARVGELETRYAFVDAVWSAFCDEIVEVLGQLADQDLILIRNGNGLFWVSPAELALCLAPVRCPHRPSVAREIYRELLGAPPPPAAPMRLVWAAVVRKLDELGLDEPRFAVKRRARPPRRASQPIKVMMGSTRRASAR